MKKIIFLLALAFTFTLISCQCHAETCVNKVKCVKEGVIVPTPLAIQIANPSMDQTAINYQIWLVEQAAKKVQQRQDSIDTIQMQAAFYEEHHNDMDLSGCWIFFGIVGIITIIVFIIRGAMEIFD